MFAKANEVIVCSRDTRMVHCLLSGSAWMIVRWCRCTFAPRIPHSLLTSNRVIKSETLFITMCCVYAYSTSSRRAGGLPNGGCALESVGMAQSP